MSRLFLTDSIEHAAFVGTKHFLEGPAGVTGKFFSYHVGHVLM